MGIDYAEYGLDRDQAIRSATQSAATQAAIDAANAEMAVLLEEDLEDRAILEERLQNATQMAENARREAKLTKKEVSQQRTTAILSKKQELVRAHLQLEATKATLNTTLADQATAQQLQIEQQLAALDSMLST